MHSGVPLRLLTQFDLRTFSRNPINPRSILAKRWRNSALISFRSSYFLSPPSPFTSETYSHVESCSNRLAASQKDTSTLINLLAQSFQYNIFLFRLNWVSKYGEFTCPDEVFLLTPNTGVNISQLIFKPVDPNIHITIDFQLQSSDEIDLKIYF